MIGDIQRSSAALDADGALQQLLALLEELIALVEEENRLLARGLPASLSGVSRRKNELADEFEGWVAMAAQHQLALKAADQAARAAFFVSVKRLRAAMDENLQRLQAAMEASRRRIDAVMRAVKSEVAAKQAYGANGRVAAPRTASTRDAISI